jgi:hypothetical protein
MPHFTWRFWCTCIVLAAASGYVLLGALQIASARARNPTAASSPAAAAAAAAAADDDDDDDDPDAGDNVAHADDDDDDSGAGRAVHAAAPVPQGGAGAPTA